MRRKLIFSVGAFLVVTALLFTFWNMSDFRRMTQWHVEVDRTKLKTNNEYDVIVVGGGFGGLSCGSMLAKNGYKVLVLEKNAVVGGLCSSYVKDGCRFHYGAEDVDGLGERGSANYLLNTLGMHKSELFVQNSHTFFDEMYSVDIGVGPDAFEAALLKKYPSDSQAIVAFFAKAREVYNEAYDAEMVKRWGIILPEDIALNVMPEVWVKNYPATHKNFLEWKDRFYQDVLDEYFTNTEIKTVLTGFVPYMGRFPFNTSAASVVIRTFGFFSCGGYQALGTPQRLADLLAATIKEHGGLVLCGQHVDKILVEDGGVRGVLVGNVAYKAPVVVCNVNTKTAYSELIDPKNLSSDFLKELALLPLGSSVLSLHLTVDNALSSRPSILQDRCHHIFIAIPTKNEPSLAPEGKSIVVVREFVRFSNFFQSNKDEKDRYLKERVSDLLERGKALIPELAQGTVIEQVVTPDTYAELVHAPYGVVCGFDATSSMVKPGFKGPVRGLYMSSAFSGGPGFDAVIATGIMCAHDIMGWPVGASE